MKNQKSGIHNGHRERMRERGMKDGFSSFADHELIEIALYYSNPRADTNPIAHALLERFGSVRGILEADIEDLKSVKGIKDNSAVLFKVLLEMMRRYADEERAPSKQMLYMSDISKFFRLQFVGLNYESLQAMYLNNRMEILKCIEITQGTVNAADVCIRRVVEQALRLNASCVVLAHNHPDGLAVPSMADLNLTDMINRSCNDLGINLLEHIIIANGRPWPIMKHHCGMFRLSPISNKVESAFFEDFYDIDEETYTFPPLM